MPPTDPPGLQILHVPVRNNACMRTHPGFLICLEHKPAVHGVCSRSSMLRMYMHWGEQAACQVGSSKPNRQVFEECVQAFITACVVERVLDIEYSAAALGAASILSSNILNKQDACETMAWGDLQAMGGLPTLADVCRWLMAACRCVRTI